MDFGIMNRTLLFPMDSIPICTQEWLQFFNESIKKEALHSLPSPPHTITPPIAPQFAFPCSFRRKSTTSKMG